MSESKTNRPVSADPLSDPLSDRRGAIERLAGDESIYGQACALFLQGYAAKLSALQQALKSGDLDQAALSAHSLKGNCAMIGAEACSLAAREVEMASRDKDLDRARNMMPGVESELARVAAALDPDFDRESGRG